MAEPITQSQLNALERAVDSVFGKLGIDVDFTRHFLDRVNDERNMRQITLRELGEIFAKEYRKWGTRISKMPVDAEAVMKDLSSAINIPFVLNPKGGEKKLVAKTVMRKKNFMSPDPTLPVESVETGSQVRGSEPTPRKRRPTSGGETPHPMRGRLVGEDFDQPPLDATTPSIAQVAQKHGVSEDDMLDRVEAGMRVEMEHTSDMQAAMEIALDHLNEQPDYYERLSQVETGAFTPEGVRASWESYQQIDEIRDPREAILQKALTYLDQKVKGKAARPGQRLGGQSLGSYAFDIVREFNLAGIATARELATMYRDWHGDSVVREGWMESNMYYLDEVVTTDRKKQKPRNK